VGERTRQRAQAALDEGRRLLFAGEHGRAADALENARRDFLTEYDLAAIREVRRAAEDGYRSCEPDDEPAFERLLYATGQNVRFLSRRRATAEGVSWEDPHPELDAPGRPEIRVERGIRRRDVPWIVVFGGLGALVVAGVVAAYVYAIVAAAREHRWTITNDTTQTAVIGTCDGSCSSVDETHVLGPGARLTIKTKGDRFAISTTAGRRLGCVDGSTSALVSAARSC
jgi:hypothetical protein